MEYKFRQPIMDVKGNFKEWFYWGFIDDTFITPANQLNGYDTRNKSQMWTGLLDKHGVEIYSGDLIHIKYGITRGSIFEVVFNAPCFHMIHAKREGDDFGVYTRRLGLDKDIEVIGNIYQNPDLLNAK